jgi:hypothetical protein
MERHRAENCAMIRLMASTVVCVLALLLVLVGPSGVEAQQVVTTMVRVGGGGGGGSNNSKCQCEQSNLQCPRSIYGNFEKTNNIREEGDKAHWALECSDGLSGGSCSAKCKSGLEKIYGKNGYCACVSDNAYHQFSMQSLTLLAMTPNQILNACFADECSYTLP